VRAALVRSPPPSGAWPVGTVTTNLGTPATVTRGAAQIWYPAPPGTIGSGAPYLQGSERSFSLRILNAVVATIAVAGAPVAAQRFPIVLYVPGWGGNRTDNTAAAQDLASNGYIVAAIDDPFPSVPMDFSSGPALCKTIAWANRKLRLIVDRIAYLLDALAVVDRTPYKRFFQRLDLERVGILGFSFGGAVAAEAAGADPRIGASVNLDGWLFGNALRTGVSCPYLAVGGPSTESKEAPGRFASEAAVIADRFDRANEKLHLDGLRRRGGYLVTIAGAGHYNFTDAGWLPTLRRTGLGPIDGRRAAAIVSAYVVQFFDQTLRARRAPLFERGARFDDAAQLLAF